MAVARREAGSGRALGRPSELFEEITGTSVDAPLCLTCGTKMRPSGSCYVCEGCGSHQRLQLTAHPHAPISWSRPLSRWCLSSGA